MLSIRIPIIVWKTYLFDGNCCNNTSNNDDDDDDDKDPVGTASDLSWTVRWQMFQVLAKSRASFISAYLCPVLSIFLGRRSISFVR